MFGTWFITFINDKEVLCIARYGRHATEIKSERRREGSWNKISFCHFPRGAQFHTLCIRIVWHRRRHHGKFVIVFDFNNKNNRHRVINSLFDWMRWTQKARGEREIIITSTPVCVCDMMCCEKNGKFWTNLCRDLWRMLHVSNWKCWKHILSRFICYGSMSIIIMMNSNESCKSNTNRKKIPFSLSSTNRRSGWWTESNRFDAYEWSKDGDGRVVKHSTEFNVNVSKQSTISRKMYCCQPR